LEEGTSETCNEISFLPYPSKEKHTSFVLGPEHPPGSPTQRIAQRRGVHCSSSYILAFLPSPCPPHSLTGPGLEASILGKDASPDGAGSRRKGNRFAVEAGGIVSRIPPEDAPVVEVFRSHRGDGTLGPLLFLFDPPGPVRKRFAQGGFRYPGKSTPGQFPTQEAQPDVTIEGRGGIEKKLWGLIEAIQGSSNRTLRLVSVGQVEEELELSLLDLFSERALKNRESIMKITLR
jgi:hypothetical protein